MPDAPFFIHFQRLSLCFFSYLPIFIIIQKKFFISGNFSSSWSSFKYEKAQQHMNEIIPFTVHYNRTKKRIFNYVLKMTGNRMLTEDLVQSVYLKFYENFDTIRNQASVEFWLFRTARNEVFNWFRQKKIKTDLDTPYDTDDLQMSGGNDPESEHSIQELGTLVNKELEKLPPEQREVFVLREYGGLHYEEIAALLDIDQNLVKSRLFKTRQKLIKKFSGYYNKV